MPKTKRPLLMLIPLGFLLLGQWAWLAQVFHKKSEPHPSGSCVIYVVPDTFICADGHAWKRQWGTWIDLGGFGGGRGVPAA